MDASSTTHLKHFVETGWLKDHLSDPDLVVIDCSWHFPDEGDAWEEYQEEHIPGALFLDIDVVSDTGTPLPHMLPSPEKFSRIIGEMGISNDSTIVVYDTYGFFCAAARVWWMFRIMGHDKVKVLNGGMPKWLDEDMPVEDGLPRMLPNQTFKVSYDSSQVRETHQIVEISKSGTEQLLDARSPQRFSGELGEPRPCQRLGHIPGSVNVYFKDFLEFDGSLKPLDEVRRLLAESPVDLNRPIVTTCGSGVTAAVMNLIFEEIGVTGTAMYDGSWSAWGCEDSGMPVATGDAPYGDT